MPSTPEDVRRLLEDTELFLTEGLQNENLNKKTKDWREALLKNFRIVKAKHPSLFQSRGDTEDYSDSSDDGHSVSMASSDGFLPIEFQDNESFEEITLVAAQELTNILKQGYLEKKRKDHSFFSSEWQKRWCVISNNIFYYFGNEKDKQQKGAFYLNNCTIHRKDSKKCHGFEVITSRKRAYQFTAANQKEASDWVDQLTFLLKDMKSTCIPYEEEDDGDNNNTESSAEAQEENINEDGDSDTYDDIDTPSHASSQALPKMGNTEEKVEDDHDDSIYEMMPEDDFTRQPSGDAGDNEIGISSGTPTFDYVNCYQGLWDCTGEGQNELSFHQGEIIYILSKEYNVYGWWVGERNGVVGIVPKDYLTAAYEI